MTDPIDHAHPALRPVRASVTARITKLTADVVNPSTPLDKVPGLRGEIAALNWLLGQLSPKQEITT